MVEIQKKRVRRVTLQCLLMMFIAVVPGAPVSEAATLVLTWDPSPDPQIIGYNVYRSESLGTFGVSALNGLTLVSDATFTDSTVEWSRTYYYVVTAVSAGGQESPPSAAVEAASLLPLLASQSEAVGAEGYNGNAGSAVGTIAQLGQPQAVETAPGAPPPSESPAIPVPTLPTPVGVPVTTSVSEDGKRWFQVNGASYFWGFDSDVPVSGDFDGDSQTDIAIFRPDDGYWWGLTSTSGFSSHFAYQWGVSTDTLVPGDYDSDGRTDIAVFRPSNGVWYILTSSSNFASSIYF